MTYIHNPPNSEKESKKSVTFTIDLTMSNACRSNMAVSIAIGVGGGLIFLVAIILLFVFLKKKRKAHEETVEAKVDVNPLYNTYYAGDERMENRTEVK